MNPPRIKLPQQSVNLVNNQAYLGALALNNIGVKLMETGSHEKALRTMLDSVKAFSCSMGETPAAAGFVKEKLRSASKRLSKQQVEVGKAATESLFYNRKRMLVFDDQEPFLRPARICLPEYIAGSVVAVQSEHDLDAAIVLCNTGLAFYLFSKTCETGSATQDALVKSAYKMLDLADQVICRQFAILSDSDPPFHELRLYSVARFVVATMIQAFNETGRAAEASSLQLKFRRLGEVIRAARTVSLEVAAE
jgi:hypothetical protein